MVKKKEVRSGREARDHAAAAFQASGQDPARCHALGRSRRLFFFCPEHAGLERGARVVGLDEVPKIRLQHRRHAPRPSPSACAEISKIKAARRRSKPPDLCRALGPRRRHAPRWGGETKRDPRSGVALRQQQLRADIELHRPSRPEDGWPPKPDNAVTHISFFS